MNTSLANLEVNKRFWKGFLPSSGDLMLGNLYNSVPCRYFWIWESELSLRPWFSIPKQLLWELWTYLKMAFDVVWCDLLETHQFQYVSWSGFCKNCCPVSRWIRFQEVWYFNWNLNIFERSIDFIFTMWPTKLINCKNEVLMELFRPF